MARSAAGKQRVKEHREAKKNVPKTDVGKPQYSKTRRTSTLAVKVEGGRKKLINVRQAISAAKGKTTKLAKKGLYSRGYSEQKGAALKKGLEGMARRINLDEETFQRIMNMDEKALDAMYQNNDILFEVAFSYSGIETDPETGAYITDEDKSAEFDFLISEYNRLFPESAV